MRVVLLTNPNNPSEGEARPSVPGDLPPKPLLLSIAHRKGIRVPESLFFEIEAQLDRDNTTAVRTLCLQVLDVILDNRAYLSGYLDSGIVFRRVAGGDNSALPLFEDCFLKSTQDLEKRLREWLTCSSQPIESFLVQRNLASPEEEPTTIGLMRSRNSNSSDSIYGWTETHEPSAATVNSASMETWRAHHPKLYSELSEWSRVLEGVYLKACDIKFFVKRGSLYLLSVHESPFAGESACQLVCEEVDCGKMSSAEAVMSLDPKDVTSQKGFIVNYDALSYVASGDAGEGRIVTGRICFKADFDVDSEDSSDILVCSTLLPSDSPALSKFVGVVVSREGPSSHTVVLARGSGKTVITGVPVTDENLSNSTVRLGNSILQKGEWITIDSETDTVYRGKARITAPKATAEARVVEWARAPEIPVMVNTEELLDADSIQVADGVGLCRSERHLSQADVLSLIDGPLQHLPVDVSASLGQKLESILVKSRGKRVNYRLLDLGDFIQDPGIKWKFRGIRWGIESGLYRDQTRIALSILKHLAKQEPQIDAALIAPFVTCEGETIWFREMITDTAKECCVDPTTVKIGVMVETVAAVLNVQAIAKHVDCICIGTNDLTEQFFDIPRDGSQRFLAEYLSRGFLRFDPFKYLNFENIGRLLAGGFWNFSIIETKPQVVVCGDHASYPMNAAWWSKLGRPVYSVRPSQLGAMRVALFQNANSQPATPISTLAFPVSFNQTSSKDSFGEIHRLIAEGAAEQAKKVAWSWAMLVAVRIGIEITGNWKFFKRDLVASWFGPTEHRRFAPGWRPDDVVSYAESIRSSKAGVRFSLFPGSIACHARSELLPDYETRVDWLKRFSNLDSDSSLEIFPQQDAQHLCFRAIAQRETTRVEAGIGQAMYVFEENRGEHQTVIAELFPVAGVVLANPSDPLSLRFTEFASSWGDFIVSKLFEMQCELGLDWIAIEGYYDRNSPLFVCDVDLPLDLAFHSSA